MGGVQFKARHAPPIEYRLELWLSFAKQPPTQWMQTLRGWPGQWQWYDATELRAAAFTGQVPQDLLLCLGYGLRAAHLRWAELGLRPVARFASGAVVLPWRKNQAVGCNDLDCLELQPGVRYQLEASRGLGA